MRTLFERFWTKITFPNGISGCWIWIGSNDGGRYGRIRKPKGKMIGAHIFSHETFIGPVPPGMQIDHVKGRGCTSMACVKPTHLEAVSPSENCRRSSAGDVIRARERTKTHCPAGHPYDDTNTRINRHGWRSCWACARASAARSNQRSRIARGAVL